MAKQTTKTTEELVNTYIPKQAKNDTQRFVSVNGKRYLIQTGIDVMVPRSVAEVIENSLRADKEAEAYVMANTSV